MFFFSKKSKKEYFFYFPSRRRKSTQQQYTFSHSCQMFNIVLTQQLMIACVYLRCIIENQLILRFFWTVCREILVLSLLSFPISPTIGCPNVLIALHQTQKMVIFHLPKKKSWLSLQCCQCQDGFAKKEKRKKPYVILDSL